nr:unnamed protein product [Callosobruchus analis]
MSRITQLEDQLEQKRQHIIRLENRLDQQKDYDDLKREISFADDSALASCMEPGKPLPSQEIARLQHHHASQINADIKKIVEWGSVNRVQFNVQKTQTTIQTRKSLVGLPTVEMEERPIVESPSVKLLEINISNNISWHDHVISIAKTASQKPGVLFRCRKSYTPEQLLLYYKVQVRPSLEYCFHVWGCAPKHSLKLLNSIRKRVVKLVDTPIFTKNLHSLEHRRRVAGLSLFYRFLSRHFKNAKISMLRDPEGKNIDVLLEKSKNLSQDIREKSPTTDNEAGVDHRQHQQHQHPSTLPIQPPTALSDTSPASLPPPFQNVDVFGSLLGEEIVSTWRRSVDLTRKSPSSASSDVPPPSKSATPTSAITPVVSSAPRW